MLTTHDTNHMELEFNTTLWLETYFIQDLPQLSP